MRNALLLPLLLLLLLSATIGAARPSPKAENFLRFWERANAARAGVPARSGPLPMSKP
ncbi:MAG: hypothetical protein ABJC28_02405 [Acidobacteriota bacterium]